MARLTACTLISVIGLSTSPALADLTPSDVWDGIKAQMSVYGTVAASETNSGSSLAVSDIVMTTDTQDMKSTTSLTGSMVFRALGDGTVAIDFPSNMAANVVASDSGGAPMTLTVNVAQEGMRVVASGDPGNMTHEFSAPSLSYSLANLIVDDQPLTASMDIALRDTSGSWVSEGTSTRRQIAKYTVDTMTVKGLFAEPGKPDQIAVDLTVNSMEVASDNTIPEGFSDLEPDEVFSTGFAVDADMSFGPVAYAVQVTAEGQTTQINGTMADGSFGIGMDGDKIRYSTVSNMVDMSGAISGLPFPPVDVHYDTSKFDILMPVGETQTPQDFGATVALRGFTVSDFLWAMVDPAQQLPRDPADVVVEMDGKANWVVNIFDPAALNGSQIPGKLESLNLKSLEVNVAGASLTGSGGFTFDNNDLQTFGGVPRPTGAVDLAMSGGITLLDKLTAMQLVPQQQAMGIKMMSGLFTKPGPTPDTLTTKLEIDASGGVFANGQRIQ